MSELAKYQMYIGGEWVDPVGGEWFDSFNPYTGQPWARMPRGGEADVDRAVTAADDAFSGGDWPAHLQELTLPAPSAASTAVAAAAAAA